MQKPSSYYYGASSGHGFEGLYGAGGLTPSWSRTEYHEKIDATVARMSHPSYCYLHEMRVKHRDLKPENILVIGDQVLISDFGVSKGLIDEETTASLTGAAPTGKPLYWAPEIDPLSETLGYRRGQAVDIFALGCIFLEMATIFIAPLGFRTRFTQHREASGR